MLDWEKQGIKCSNMGRLQPGMIHSVPSLSTRIQKDTNAIWIKL